MPIISSFFGIVIRMFYRDHEPPHFHAVYGEYEASIEIEPIVIHGSLPPTAQRLVVEWASLHKAELLENWRLAREGQPLNAVEPLD